MEQLTAWLLIGCLVSGCGVVARNPMRAPLGADVRADQQTCEAQAKRDLKSALDAYARSPMGQTMAAASGLMGPWLGALENRPGPFELGKFYRACMKAKGYDPA